MKSLHLLYHELRPEGSRYSYVSSCEAFEAHCALYAKLQSAPDEGMLRPEITFDDGHRSDLLCAAPILAQFGLRATFFITSGWTGQRAGFMSWQELRSLQAAGHRIGAHGRTHKLLTSCTDAELRDELESSRKSLEDGLGAPVHIMSLPGGRANPRVDQACRQAGFKQVFTSVPRAESMDSLLPTVGRLNLVGGTTVSWLQQVLRMDSGVLAKLQRVDRVKALAKQVLGDRLYAQLWAIASRQEPEGNQPEALAP